MSNYRLYTSTTYLAYRVQERRWWGWKTIYKSAFYDSAKRVLKDLQQQEAL